MARTIEISGGRQALVDTTIERTMHGDVPVSGGEHHGYVTVTVGNDRETATVIMAKSYQVERRGAVCASARLAERNAITSDDAAAIVAACK